MPDPKVRDMLPARVDDLTGRMADLVAEVREVTAAGQSHVLRSLLRGGQTVTRWQRVFVGVFMAGLSHGITGAVVTSGDTDDAPSSRCETWDTCRP
jgi:hypothetical protein